MKTTLRSRALFTCFLLAGGFTLFSFRLIHVQVAMADEFSAEAAQKHTRKQAIYARRGTIMDVHGEPLAQNEPVKTVIADASLIKDPPAFAALIAKRLAMKEKDVLELIGRKVKKADGTEEPACYITLRKDLPEATALELGQLLASKEVQKQKIAYHGALRFEQDFVRIYPNGSLLCHVLGFTNSKHVGMDGIERTMDQYLSGDDGFRYIERDRQGGEIVPYRGQERAPRDGFGVVLTIDMGLQNIVEQELAAAVKQFRPKSATVILMQPKTGAILAMATAPNFDLNKQDGVPEENRRNRAITDMVEPGSIFKIVTTSAALTERLVRPDTYIFCENGYWGTQRLHDHHPYSSITVHEGLVKSSNILMGKLAVQLGEQKFHEYVRKFGFGEPTGVSLPGEIRGLVNPTHTWSKLSITRVPMGHEVGATPLQMTTAMCAIANGGQLMMPQIVHKIVDGAGNTVAEFPPQEVRRVVARDATQEVRTMLMDVVSKKGTAAGAAVAGYAVAGKTGTAQKLGPDGRYSHERYIVSFLGYMPAEDPAFVGLVMIDEATQVKRGENYGGLVAAPVFAKIGAKAARYLHLPPTLPLTPGPITAAVAPAKPSAR